MKLYFGSNLSLKNSNRSLCAIHNIGTTHINLRLGFLANFQLKRPYLDQKFRTPKIAKNFPKKVFSPPKTYYRGQHKILSVFSEKKRRFSTKSQNPNSTIRFGHLSFFSLSSSIFMEKSEA